MNTFYKSILAENFKIKRNLMFLALCLFPLAVTLMMSVGLGLFTDIPNVNFWAYYTMDIFMFYTLLYPIMLSLIAYVYVNLEIKNNFHKQLFCLPIKPYKIYLAKCTVLFYYYTVSVIIAYISFIIGIYLLGAYIPEVGESIRHYDTKPLVDLLFIKTYIVMLPVIFFQYAMSLAIPKVWFPCTVALLLYVSGMMLYKNDYYYLLPNASFTKLAYQDFFRHENIVIFDKAFTTSMIYSVLFIAVGFFTFKMSKDKIDS